MPPSGARKRALVVDASVARAANPQPMKPQAQACYQALDAIWRLSYVVVMTPELKKEWQQHMSRHTEKWLARMARRSRVWTIALHRSELRATLEALRDEPSSEHAGALQALLEDVHLIEAALQVEQGEKPVEGRRVLSADKGVRKDIAQLRPRLEASADFEAVCAVQWVNPLEDDAVAWLEAGAPPRPAHRLC